MNAMVTKFSLIALFLQTILLSFKVREFIIFNLSKLLSLLHYSHNLMSFFSKLRPSRVFVWILLYVDVYPFLSTSRALLREV
jgi:hypothetical protein